MNATQEVWRPVPGFEEFYEVSNLGRVRSFDRYSRAGGPHSVALHHGRVLRPQLRHGGHLAVQLCDADTGRRDSRLVHILVLELFVGPCPSGMEACHNNGIPADNRLSNLRWDTRRENTLDRVRHGKHHMANKTHCPRNHEYTPENTRLVVADNGTRRICRACEKDRQARNYQTQKAKGIVPRRSTDPDARARRRAYEREWKRERRRREKEGRVT